MKHKLRFSLAVLMIMILNAGADFASAVTVRGHDGSELALSQIPDIIRHVTGQTSGDLSFGKDSLLVTLLNGDRNSGYNLNFNVLDFDKDGKNTSAGQEEVQNQTTYCDVLDDSKAYYSQKIPMVTYPQKASDGINAALAIQFKNGGCGVSVYSPRTDSDGNTKVFVATMDAWGAQTLRDKLGLSAVPHAIENGMTVKGTDCYISAVLVRDSSGPHVYFVQTLEDDSDSNDTAKIPCDYSQTIADESMPKFSDATIHFPASIAAGDFNNDGYRNELALTWSDIDHVYLRVLQLSYNTGTKQYSLNEIYSSTLHDYEYDSVGIERDRGKDMDGVATIYSVSVTAGNFDGLPGDEFAVVFRDNHPDDVDHIYKAKADYDFDFFDTGYRADIFDGLTGGVNVVTHKWDGSTFQTVSARKTYDSYSTNDWSSGTDVAYVKALEMRYYLPVAVKAVAADMNGDGRDEIVVQKMVLDFRHHREHRYNEYRDPAYSVADYMVYYRVRNCIDVWNFARGSIQANPASNFDGLSSQEYRGGQLGPGPVNDGSDNWHYTRPTFLKTITRATTPYPFFEREFDIVKGKFTGRIGDVTTVDELIVKYPTIDHDNQTKDDGTNYVYDQLSLLKDYDGSNFTEVNIQSIQRNYAVGLMRADFLGESVKLGDPVKTVDRADLDYTAILQMMPYHVDNITADGKSLTDKPQNFTLLLNADIKYENSSSTSDKKSMTYSMTSTAETIFALDSSFTRGAASTFQGVRGITSTLIGDTPAGKAIEGIGKFWDKLKDTVETTKSTSNTSEYTSMMSIATQANYLDTLYVNTSDRYIWRYPVENPPSWILERTLSNYGTFDKSKAKTQQTYITFAMSEPGIPTAAKGTNDSHYQPYHESGNLFSYPAALEQIEGYEGHKSLLSGGSSAAKRWDGSAISETITFVNTTTDQESTKKTNKAGAITKFLSAVDNIFGSSFANVPYDTVSSFTRNVSNKESISVNIPGALSGAQFSAVFEPYLDVTGATVVGFAVESFRDIDALWNQDSLYSKKPDPSFLLPEKFNCTSLAQSVNQFAEFSVNTNDETAMKGRGIRYTAADYDMETNNLLMNGVKYKITIPVYNASFVTAPEFKVRLSYTGKLDYSVKKTPIGEYTFTSLPGRGKGNHRQFAEFEWTPNVEQGIYYLFAEIDPDNKLKDGEVHKNRHVSSSDRTIADYGGNNMAYFKIGISNTDTVPFDRTKLETQYRSASFGEKFAAADISPSEFPFVEWVKVDSMDFRDFIEQKVDGQTEPVAGEVEVKYVGEELMTDAVLIGYALKPESSNKSISEINDADIGLLFVKEHFALFPDEDHKLHFRINPNDLANGVGFLLQVYGQEYPLTDIIHGSSGINTGVSSSSSGCETFAGSMAGVLALILIMKKRTR